MTVKHLQTTGMPPNDLNKNLLSLALGKVKLLNKSSEDKKILETDAFSFNSKFRSKLFKLKVTSIQTPKETETETKETREKVDEDRKHQIEVRTNNFRKCPQRGRKKWHFFVSFFAQGCNCSHFEIPQNNGTQPVDCRSYTTTSISFYASSNYHQKEDWKSNWKRIPGKIENGSQGVQLLGLNFFLKGNSKIGVLFKIKQSTMFVQIQHIFFFQWFLCHERSISWDQLNYLKDHPIIFVQTKPLMLPQTWEKFFFWGS